MYANHIQSPKCIPLFAICRLSTLSMCLSMSTHILKIEVTACVMEHILNRFDRFLCSCHSGYPLIIFIQTQHGRLLCRGHLTLAVEVGTHWDPFDRTCGSLVVLTPPNGGKARLAGVAGDAGAGSQSWRLFVSWMRDNEPGRSRLVTGAGWGTRHATRYNSASACSAVGC